MRIADVCNVWKSKASDGNLNIIQANILASQLCIYKSKRYLEDSQRYPCSSPLGTTQSVMCNRYRKFIIPMYITRCHVTIQRIGIIRGPNRAKSLTLQTNMEKQRDLTVTSWALI